MSVVELTQEFETSETEFIYLIRIDGEESSYVKSEILAREYLNALAVETIEEFDTSLYKVFRTDKGTSVIISTQRIGYVYDGSPKQKHVIDFVSIPLAFPVKKK